MGCGQAPLRVGWWSILQICRAGLLKKGAKNGTFCELYKVLISVYKYFDDVADVAARGHTTRRACRWCRLQQPIILQQFEFWIQMVVYVIVIFARRKNKTKSMTTRCRAIFIQNGRKFISKTILFLEVELMTVQSLMPSPTRETPKSVFLSLLTFLKTERESKSKHNIVMHRERGMLWGKVPSSWKEKKVQPHLSLIKQRHFRRRGLGISQNLIFQKSRKLLCLVWFFKTIKLYDYYWKCK